MELGWVDEGFLQLHLALVWERLAIALARRRPTAALARELKEDVIAPFLQAEWLNGVPEVARRLAKQWAAGTWPGPVAGWIADTQKAFVDQFAAAEASTQQDRAVYAGEIEARLIQAIFGSAALAPTDAGRPAIPPVDALNPRAEDVALYRWRQGQALATWETLRATIANRNEADACLVRLQRLGDDCRELREWIADWSRGARALNAHVGSSGLDNRLLVHASECLGRCEGEFDAISQRMQFPVSEEHLEDLRDLLRRADRCVTRAPDDWSPQILADLRRNLATLVPTRLANIFPTSDGDPTLFLNFSATEVPQDSFGKLEPTLLIVAALASRLDELGLEDSNEDALNTAWDALERAANRMATGVEPEARVAFVREREPYRGAIDEVEVDASHRTPAFRVVGIVIVQKADAPKVVRRAVLESPKRPLGLTSALLDLAAALERKPSNPSFSLAAPCRDLATAVNRHRSVADWWSEVASRDGDSPLGDLWQVVQRVAALPGLQPEFSPLAAAVLAELTKAGFSFYPAAPGANTFRATSDKRPWLLLPEPGLEEAIPLLPRSSEHWGVGLRTPDDRVLLPDSWLRIPASWVAESPLFRLLVDAQPLISGLFARTPDWEGWTKFDDQVWDLAYRTEHSGPNGVDHRVASAAFEAVYRRALQAHDDLSLKFRELARRLYRTLTREMGLTFKPALDETTLDVLPLKALPCEGVECHWVENDQPARSVLKVKQFGAGTQPAVLEVSLGRGFPRSLAAWLTLPPLESLAAEGVPAADDNPAGRWYRLAQADPFHPDLSGSHPQKFRERFREWAVSESGSTWFDILVRSAVLVKTSGGSARRWLDALLHDHWCVLFPDFNDTSGRAAWPRKQSISNAPLVVWKFSDDVPKGESIDGAFRFATRIDRVEGTFSLGKRRSPSTLDSAEKVMYAVSRSAALTKKLGRDAEILLHISRDNELGAPLSISSAKVVEPLLDGLAQLAQENVEASALDRVLEGLRGWCARQQLAILPAGWAFSNPPPTSVAPAEFSAEVPAGQARLRKFGLVETSENDRVLHEPLLMVSAGPAPTGWAELREILPESGHHAAAQLSEALERWPGIQLAEGPGSLEFPAKHLFNSIWDRAPEFPRPSPTLETALQRLLSDSFGLEVFEPRSTRDRPYEWLNVISRGTRNTGRVSRVIRPGLATSAGALCYPAYVELE